MEEDACNKPGTDHKSMGAAGRRRGAPTAAAAAKLPRGGASAREERREKRKKENGPGRDFTLTLVAPARLAGQASRARVDGATE